MSISTDMRYAARTSCPELTSNQNDPTDNRQFGRRGSMRSSRSAMTFPSESWKKIESPVEKR